MRIRRLKNTKNVNQGRIDFYLKIAIAVANILEPTELIYIILY